MGIFKRNRMEGQPSSSSEAGVDVEINQIRARNLAREALIQAQRLDIYEQYESPSGFLSPQNARRAQDQARERVSSMEQGPQ